MANTNIIIEDTTQGGTDSSRNLTYGVNCRVFSQGFWGSQFSAVKVANINNIRLENVAAIKPIFLESGLQKEMSSSDQFDDAVLPFTRYKDLTASEALSAGNIVNIWNDSGTVKVRKANATAAGKEANGYILAGISSGASGTVYFSNVLTGLAGLTAGELYYLSTTGGAVTSTAPSTSGNIKQIVGRALSASEIAFVSGYPELVP